MASWASHWRPSLAAWPRTAAAYELAAGSRLRAGRWQPLTGWPLAAATWERHPAACPFAGATLWAAATLAGWS
ncbi:hypothetical protein BHM03_00029812 [Ensete ventricosum]|nr:hypothetical protein BHM03_00029812 [Ensete ventricosum]